MRTEIIQKIINILTKEGFKNINIGKEKNKTYVVSIKTNLNNEIEFEADEDEITILKKLLDIHSSEYTDEGEIDDDISKAGDEIDTLYQQWAKYVDEMDEGGVEKEKIKLMEMEIEIISRKIKLLKRQMEILGKEKKGIAGKKIVQQMNEESTKQQTMVIMHELMLKEYNNTSKSKTKTRNQTPTMRAN